MTVAAVLLAAGRSTRFGTADKLASPLGDRALGLHAARTLASVDTAMRFVVVNRIGFEWPFFQLVFNDRPELGMSYSIALGAAAARRAGAEAVLIALADMPFVPAGHFERLLASHRGSDSLIASSDGVRRMPPALFGADWFGELENLWGDQGARQLLGNADVVMASAADLLDVDRVEDLGAARARFPR